MARAAFETLEVYRLAEELCDEVLGIVLGWNAFARDTIGKQLVKAADSIGANIAEGFGRGSTNDNRRFIRIARGSLNETLHWLRRAYRRKLISANATACLRPFLDELGPRPNAYLRSIGRRTSAPARTNHRPPTDNTQQTTYSKQRTTREER